MRTKLLVTLLTVFFYNISNAQLITLKVTVKVNGKDSLTNATIQLYSLPDTLLASSQVSKLTGNTFHIKSFSRYLVKVSAIGFAEADKTITATNKSIFTTIELKPKNNALNEVVITAKKPLMKQVDDKTIIDAEVLANSSTNAYEVLEKTPGAVVDQDGNVYLSSTTPATVYINGRQMRMSTDDITTLLKSLPAGSIDKIEIIRTPSAKYDASNSGGIVNIVLKKGVKIGTTGSVNVRYDQGVYGTTSAGFSINKSVGKINTYLSYQYTHRNYYEDIQSNRQTGADTLLIQKSTTKYSPTTNYVGGGVDLEVTKKFDVAYDLRLTANNNSSTALSSNDFINTNTQTEFYKSQTPISNNGPSLFVGNALSSKYKIDSLGSEWTNEIDYTYSNSNNLQLYTNYYFLPPDTTLAGNGTTRTSANIVDIKTDLSLRLKHQFTLETGIKISTANNTNDALYYTQTGNSPKLVDNYQTNTFTYKEDINAAYAQLSKTVSGIIFKAGLRYENTNITGHQFIPSDTSFHINRNDLFPYFYIKRNLFKVLGYPLVGNVIYRRSITRPGYDALNPSPKFVDPFTYNVGDPKLQPQFTTNYEINATYNDFPVFAIGVNNTKDVFSQVTYQNDTTKIAYRTYDNLGNSKEIYARLFGGLPAGGKYFMYVGAQYNYIQYNGTYENLPLNYSHGSWTFFTGNELKATPTLRFNLNAWMYVNGFRSFNVLKTLGQLNLSITKTVLNKKLSIILSGNDILKTNKTTFHLQQGDVLVNGTRVTDSQRLGLTLRYNFGIARKEEKKENFTQPPVNTDPNNN
jgi:iron complex outermembrane receptor protein